MSIRKEQEKLSNILSMAEQYTRNGEGEKARRALVCAAAKLLEIADNSAERVKPIMQNKAYSIVKESVHITAESFDELIEELRIDELGAEYDESEEDTVSDEKVTFDQVVGLDEVKDTINREIIYPRIYSNIYKKYAKKAGGGILLYGLPGTGKTMIAKAIANEIHAKFYEVKCSDILSKWFGESEQKIKQLFDEAKQNKLSIIFFDEFEALAKQRGECRDAMSQVVPELLVAMQGFTTLKNVIILCATNRPWDIDSAFLRPGRLTNRIYVGLPNREARLLMLSKRLEGIPCEEGMDFNRIIDATEGFSGADMDELCEMAKSFAIMREISSGMASSLNMDDFVEARSKVHSSIHAKDIKEMDMYEKGFRFIMDDVSNRINNDMKENRL